MLEKITNDEKFKELTLKNIEGILEIILEKNIEFGILARFENVKITPQMPEEFNEHFEKEGVIFLMLANYTLQSAYLQNSKLIFEAGFGDDDIGREVEIPFFAIKQIIVENNVLAINTANFDLSFKAKEKSKSIFTRNLD